MIEQLMVKNYILFDQAFVDFRSGMSVITGETGAGKSLLIDAIGYLCGNRISSNIVRKGKEKAILQMVLSHPNEKVCQFLSNNNFDIEEELIINRSVTNQGKSSIRINQQITTLSFIRKLMAQLIDIHSQMDTIQLMDPQIQLELLDQYANVAEQKKQVQEAYRNYSKAKNALTEAKNETFSNEELDFVTAQFNEIDEAKIQENELEELQEKIKTVSRSQKNLEDFDTVIYALKKENGILDQLYLAYKAMHKNNLLVEDGENIHSMYYQLSDLSERLQEEKDAYLNDVNDLDSMQEREYQIKKMYRKYGGSYAAMMEYKSNCESKIDKILHRQDIFEKLEKEVKATLSIYTKLAKQLSSERKAVFKELEEQIERHCKDLMLENARFSISCQPSKPTSQGMDEIEFLVSMNPGQPLTSLRESASGGELARLMLALKTVFQTKEGIDTILFDEIDTGVSGKVALAMGGKMHTLSKNHQVLCITHLPSVAVWAQDHYCVAKSTDGKTTTTSIRLLNQEERIAELATMASGAASESAMESMRELYNEVHHG